MKKGELLNKMLVLATNAHAGQYDKGGLPYILHPLKVMHYLKTDDEELQCIALGHDLVEDTNVTLMAIHREFGGRVVSAIEALTRDNNMSYKAYKDQVMRNPDAIRVKMADLRHNTDIRRLRGVTAKDLARIQDYHEFYTELKAMVV